METNPSSGVDNQRDMAEEEAKTDVKASKTKDIRNYLCQYCGIRRSKKYLITSHINSHHKMEVEEERDDEACEDGEEATGKHTCQECGAQFKKPAHLKQHMQSHSLERPFACYVDDCVTSYRRKDHLNRHLLTHKGKLFKCPMENCKSEFSVHGNVNRHVKKFHSDGHSGNDDTSNGNSSKDDTCNGDSGKVDSGKVDSGKVDSGKVDSGKVDSGKVDSGKVDSGKVDSGKVDSGKVDSGKVDSGKDDSGKDDSGKDDTGKDDTGNGDSQPPEILTGQKQHVCKEIGCGKAFKYASRLQKHQDSHVKLDSVEAFCSEPGCMKYFTNEDCLKAHIRSSHQHINCEICGSKHLKKNIKRHLRTHDEDSSPGEFKCEVEGCSCTFSKVSNLQKHVKAVHEDIRPFVCGFPGCGMRFAYKHVRNNHENSGFHTYTCGDFVEADEDFTSRPRGGLKRKQVTAEMLIRKRVMPPQFDSEEHETC